MISKWQKIQEKFILKSRVFSYSQIERASTITPQKKNIFDIITCPPWINVIALTEKKEVVFVRQYRHGIDDITLEIPGGVCHPQEDPMISAKRELSEETGYRAQLWTNLGKVHANPAFMTNTCHFFLAQNLSPGLQELDPDEEIDIQLIPIKEVYELISAGKISHALVVAAFFFYRMKYE